MSEQVTHLLESIIQITKERDKRSLIHVLIEVLSDFISVDAIVVLQRIPGSSDKYLEVSDTFPANISGRFFNQITGEDGLIKVLPDEHALSCIQNKTTTHAGNNNHYFPVFLHRDVLTLVAFFNLHLTTNTEKLINGFLRIYSNFLNVLDESEHDTLTNLLNRKTLDTQLTQLLADIHASRYESTSDERREAKHDSHYWVGILDIDHFKDINDEFGHIYGDEVLLLFSDLMKKSFRQSDLLFRYGGEEFVVVLAPTTYEDAMLIFRRFAELLNNTPFPQVGKVTASIGVVKVELQLHTSTVLEHADKALYYAKEHGRNQVQNYNDLIASGEIKERQFDTDIELF